MVALKSPCMIPSSAGGRVEKLFEILEGKKNLPQWAYMFSTHPSPRQRILDLKKYAVELSIAGTPDRENQQ